ncbi:diphosphate--fructose-6-phosphate 1-phosphotransferase [Candidatus Sumerlaeota bacterium]|nr:diphosphate--fructose-6-phosphate 1-phosphotransferase [Candidatus Sumerlaeota bacterium]
MTERGNLVVGQSGGPTAVINRSVAGIVHEALEHKQIGKILGARNGIQGIIEGKFIDLRAAGKQQLARMAELSGAALGSCRFLPKQEHCEKVFEVFRKMDVRYFFYIGGNDSALAASIVNRIARDRNWELRIFHVPKTIDNDLPVTDHCPGFPSAGRYVALCFLGNDLDNQALPGIKIDIVMGRQAGWLTTTAAMGAEQEGDGPHLLYFPERPKSLTELIADIERVYRKYARALVGISEGIVGPDENEYVQSNAIREEAERLCGKVFVEWLDKFGEVMDRAGGAKRDAFGHIQLSGTGILADFISMVVKAVLNPRFNNKLRVRADTLGYAQRSFAGCVSENDAREAYEVGRRAVRFAVRGGLDGSVVIERVGSARGYRVKYALAKLDDVTACTKDVPDEFFNKEGNGVTQACRDYLAPLIGRLPKRARLEIH